MSGSMAALVREMADRRGCTRGARWADHGTGRQWCGMPALPPTLVPVIRPARYFSVEQGPADRPSADDWLMYSCAESLSDWWSGHGMTEITETVNRHPSGTVIVILRGRTTRPLGGWAHEHVFAVSFDRAPADAAR
jgi:hypothetical protein